MPKEISIDTFLSTGKTHNLCQDFVLSQNDPYPAIVLCDGCSSAPGSEFGAQLISRTFLNMLNQLPELFVSDIDNFLKCVYSSVDLHIRILNGSNDMLFCTLLYLVYIDGKIYSNVIGDGCLFTISKIQDREAVQKIVNSSVLSFSNSMPYYYCYEYLNMRDTYTSQENEQFKCCNLHGFSISTDLQYPSALFKDKITKDEISSLIHSRCIISDNEIIGIGITSDGISSFIEKQKRNVISTTDILKNMLSFKSINGEFLKRRCKRMLSDYEKENIVPLDDFSCGVMYFSESEETERQT